MRKTCPLAFIGGGTMAEAIVRGVVAAGTIKIADIAVAEPRAQRRAVFAALGVQALATSAEAIQWLREQESGTSSGAGQILLAVKPQSLEEVAGQTLYLQLRACSDYGVLLRPEQNDLVFLTLVADQFAGPAIEAAGDLDHDRHGRDHLAGLDLLDEVDARAVAAAVEISPEDRAVLVEELGWFGELAAAGRGGGDAARRDALLASAMAVAGVIFGIAILGLIGGVLGFVGLVLAVGIVVYAFYTSLAGRRLLENVLAEA